MAFSDWIDGAIAPIAPEWAARRVSARARLDAAVSARDGIRQYDAAARDRRTNGWNRAASSADGENASARHMLGWAGHDLVRNNKYAAAAVRQLVATIWGDGIGVQLTHPVKRVRERAQAEWDRWSHGRVDGLGDWYGHGKLSVREMIVGGESLTVWHPDDSGPNGIVVGLEGPQLDMSRNYLLNDGGRVVQGVQFNRVGIRTGYWLYPEHPNDPVRGSASVVSSFISVDQVDHLFERLRHRQTRGVSWLGAVAMTLRDVGDIEDAKRLQEKVQACLALVVQPGEGQATSPLGAQAAPQGDTGGKPLEETLRPGMIARLKAGETATVVNPTPSSSTVEFIRQQIAAVSANMIPYHLMTGDVSQANYSGLRAAMNGSYALVDDWQQNEVIPLLVKPAVQRRMQRLVLETGDPRFLQVGMTFALPVRRLVDPVKDLMGEIMEIRAGLKLLGTSLAERGANTEEHMAGIKAMNDVIDKLGLALDTDPRRVTDSGVLQMATGFLAPKE
ncbi:phage portal protein, lambda family [Sphingomonas gellani]|uniref:Phage portal protein, lambda family n=1 Tax=Sphingomonas gellani TaxID=1166340 RepID=A0A1H7ZY85_9SPHN|nr:phage portal protein [Sphingomonas gellani]SEM62684.1 phage portal protein, lambda family [Sphingomonas gellani]